MSEEPIMCAAVTYYLNAFFVLWSPASFETTFIVYKI